MVITDFAATVYSSNLDGSNPTCFFSEGDPTGVAYVELPGGDWRHSASNR